MLIPAKDAAWALRMMAARGKSTEQERELFRATARVLERNASDEDKALVRRKMEER